MSHAAPANLPKLNWLERLVRWLLLQWFDRSGWTVAGTLPPDRKFVIMGASHTSNWDFLVFLGAVHAIGRQVHFIGKHSLFRWPLGGFMRALGGVPVDRSAPQDLVSQIVAQFDAHDDFILVDRARRNAVVHHPTGKAASTRSLSRPACRSLPPVPTIPPAAACSAR